MWIWLLRKWQYRGFVVDKITNCIEEITTGIFHDTDIVSVSKSEIKQIYRKDGWRFNWRQAFVSPDVLVYKLTIRNQEVIQGLIALELHAEQRFIELHLIENAPHNFGRSKKYAGVAANLVAFACKTSFELGFEGFVAFKAKSRLKPHYRKMLGARDLGFDNRMALFTEESKNLVNSYYPDFIP